MLTALAAETNLIVGLASGSVSEAPSAAVPALRPILCFLGGSLKAGLTLVRSIPTPDVMADIDSRRFVPDPLERTTKFARPLQF